MQADSDELGEVVQEVKGTYQGHIIEVVALVILLGLPIGLALPKVHKEYKIFVAAVPALLFYGGWLFVRGRTVLRVREHGLELRTPIRRTIARYDEIYRFRFDAVDRGGSTTMFFSCPTRQSNFFTRMRFWNFMAISEAECDELGLLIADRIALHIRERLRSEDEIRMAFCIVRENGISGTSIGKLKSNVPYEDVDCEMDGRSLILARSEDSKLIAKTSLWSADVFTVYQLVQQMHSELYD